MEIVITVRLVLVPRVGVEPTRPCRQRILSPFSVTLPNLTKRDESIFTGLLVVKVNYVRLCLNTNQPHLSLIVAAHAGTPCSNTGVVQSTPAAPDDGPPSCSAVVVCFLSSSLLPDKYDKSACDCLASLPAAAGSESAGIHIVLASPRSL